MRWMSKPKNQTYYQALARKKRNENIGVITKEESLALRVKSKRNQNDFRRRYGLAKEE